MQLSHAVQCYTDTAWGEFFVQRLQNRAACIIVRPDSASEALKTLDTVFRLQMFIIIHFIAIMICICNRMGPRAIKD